MTKVILKKNLKPNIYLLSPPNLKLEEFTKLLESVFSLGIVTIFQLRLKNCSDQFLHTSIKLLKNICKKKNVLFILNDRPDLVKIYNLDGVHVGEKDLSIKSCRKIM